ncbi:MAG TPA: hypothetical protein VNN10_01835 [Dehalococcoidia bacterium]|nr:hypothetical protein [Dehalococcoidia bacterium]
MLVLALGWSGCGGGDSGQAPDLAGTYALVGDVGGTQVRADSRVLLTLNPDGTLSMLATRPGEEVSDSGTWSVRGGRMSIELRDLGISAKDQPFKISGDELQIPIQIFGEGPGASLWRKTDATLAQSTTAPAGTAAPSGAAGVTLGVQGDWQIYDIDKYATAAAMKTFLDAVNGGQNWEDAVKAAVAKARTFSNVSDVVLSPNGLNATIRYRDGRDEYLITERFTLTLPGGRGSAAPHPELYASAKPPRREPSTLLATYAATECSALPSNPTGIARVGGTNLAEPGREGLQPRPGVFLVPSYNPNDQPRPIKSDDSPPASARRALLFAPLYQVPHPGPVYTSADKKVAGMWSGFKETTGSNIECLSEDLRKGGYTLDTVLGRVQGGRRVETGLEALLTLTRKLTTTEYGVLYFLTHGAELNDRLLKIEMGALDEADRRRIAGSGRLDHESIQRLQDAIRDQVAREAGLAGDQDFRRTIYANTDINGFIELWVSADFFRLLREKKGLDFSDALVFVNACSSAANQSLQAAFDARVYFGWDQPPDLVFASEAAMRIFDLLPDKARSARNAWQMWARYEGWLEAAGGRERPARTKIERLRAYGRNGIAYPRMADQTVVLIYRMRFGPPAGPDRLQGALNVVTACWNEYWSSGRAVTGLQSTACSMIQLSSNRAPTQDEYEDAVHEVGGPIERPYGRWTLAD